MKIKRKEEITKLLLIIMTIIIFFIFLFTYLTIKEYKNYNDKVNTIIINIIELVNNKYPNQFDEEIVNILNDSNLEDIDESILDRYGIDYNNEIMLSNLKKEMNINIVINIVIIILLVISLLLVVIIYFKKRDKQIKKITKYIKEINNKNYDLDIAKNDEGELSILRNELYKMTVMLKEQADNSINDKNSLMTSLADISHQLKTPLTGINIMLDNIKENDNMDEKTRKDFINEISRQINNMNFLVLTLLKLSKFDANAVIFKKEDISVNNLINESLNNLAVLTELKDITIIKNIPNNVVIKVDYKWEIEAISNIIKNSLEHTDNNKKIFIEVTDNNLYTKIIIKDEGIGIKKEDLKNIFKRFYKGTNSNENSFGIGLSLAKQIIEKDNGFIKVNSIINKGTTFEIKFMKTNM